MNRKRYRPLKALRQSLLHFSFMVRWMLLQPFLLVRQLWRRNPARTLGMSIWGFILFCLVRPLWIGGSLFRFTKSGLHSCWRSAGFWTFVRGTPALLAILFVGYVCAATIGRRTDEQVQTYSLAAQRAQFAEQYDAARVYYERLIELDGERPKTLHQLALVLHQLEEEERVDSLLAKIAPYQDMVYAPAHVWQAKRILGSADRRPQDDRLAESHLVRALHLEPENLEAQVLLGQIYVASQRYDEARPLLAQAQRVLPQLSLLLAKTYAVEGFTEQARRSGQQAQQYFKSVVERDPNNQEARLSWAEATMFLEEFSEAVEILTHGARMTGDDVYRVALARVYLGWADKFGETDEDLVKKLRLHEAALKMNPREMLIFDRIMKVLKDGRTADDARAMLTTILAEGQAPALVHLLLGTDAGERGEREKAVYHLQRAYEIDEKMSIAANNLAWHLAQSDPPQLEEALTLIDNLTQQFPEVAHFRDTRGHILVKMGRWREAIADLEAALPSMRTNIETHQALAEAYREVGLDELATEHTRIATELARRQ